MSRSVPNTQTGRKLHLYAALLECGFHDGQRPHPGTSAAIWHRIDMIRAGGGAPEEIRLLEGIAVEVHVLDQSLRDLAEEVDDDLMPRVRIAALTREWLAYAPLQG